MSSPAARKRLGPPKGAGDAAAAAAAILGARFQHPDDSAPEAPELPGEDASAVPHTHVDTPPKRVPKRQPSKPDGMTRETYYVTEVSAAALRAAVEKVNKATGKRLKIHEILSALLLAAAGQTDAVTASLRAELRAALMEND